MRATAPFRAGPPGACYQREPLLLDRLWQSILASSVEVQHVDIG